MEAHFETFRSLAQIAIAFAGFAALAGIIGDRARPATQHNLVRLQAVVYTSLVLLISAYLPIVAAAYGIGETGVWRIASAISLPLDWFTLASVVRLGRRSGLHSADRWFAWTGYSLEVLVELPLVINLLALVPRHAAALYLTSLFAVLTQTAIAFVLLIATLLGSDDDR
jgi:hypothetical protein